MKFAALIPTLALLAVATPANATTIRCQAGVFWFDNAKADVTVTIDEDRNSGTINVFGVTHAAACTVKGLERRCDFGEDFDYALVIEPGGNARYYDFSQTRSGQSVRPSQLFTCK
ncbi:hypothetical protein [Hoeflea sp.]|uniref:hypothetical protein n=1 Tax=Hoeflea sp. TaxID=1940281 RepID=UPI003B02042F